MVMKPAWLEALMAETFFHTCGLHQNRRKNEKNIFCLDCCQSFCPHCLPSHHSHPLLQVRRYVYQDVVRLDDLEKLIDCSYIQPYTINSAKVIFLNQRAQSRSLPILASPVTEFSSTHSTSVLFLARLITWFIKVKIYQALYIGLMNPISPSPNLKGSKWMATMTDKLPQIPS